MSGAAGRCWQQRRTRADMGLSPVVAVDLLVPAVVESHFLAAALLLRAAVALLLPVVVFMQLLANKLYAI